MNAQFYRIFFSSHLLGKMKVIAIWNITLFMRQLFLSMKGFFFILSHILVLLDLSYEFYNNELKEDFKMHW